MERERVSGEGERDRVGGKEGERVSGEGVSGESERGWEGVGTISLLLTSTQ